MAFQIASMKLTRLKLSRDRLKEFFIVLYHHKILTFEIDVISTVETNTYASFKLNRGLLPILQRPHGSKLPQLIGDIR